MALIGVGLMGGSLGAALRQRGLARSVVGYDVDRATLHRAEQTGILDSGARSMGAAARGADFVVVAAPLSAIPGALDEIAPHVGPAALITDLGSVKTGVVAAGERLFGSRFVGGHPMCGSQQSGIAAARPDLFEGAAWALTPSTGSAGARSAHAANIAALVTALGARPFFTDPGTHDRIAALISHLPHALAFCYARQVALHPESLIAAEMAGGSYRDLTRVAASSPGLWRDIFLENRQELLAALDQFGQHAAALRSAIQNGDVKQIADLLESGQRP